MYVNSFKAAFAKGLIPTSEAEVSFNCTEKRFNSIVASLQTSKTPVVRATTLDVSYAIATAKENSSYRLTYVNDADIQRILGIFNAPKADPLAIYKNCVREYASSVNKNISMIKKTRDKKKSVEIDVSGTLLRLSNEEPLNVGDEKHAEIFEELYNLKKLRTKQIGYRLKDRYTQFLNIANPNYVIRIDATRVTSFSDPSHPTYEVEIELTSKSVVKTVPVDILDIFANEITRVHELVHAKSVSAKSSASSASSASSESSVSTLSDVSSFSSARKKRGVPKDAVQPSSWILANRKGFFDWMYNTFKYSKQLNSEAPPGQITLFPHQKLIRDFMYIESPYRGILLYHGLGVGKTIASIAAAMGFVNNRKKVIIMIPASLETNYREEIIKVTTYGNPDKKLWTCIKITKPAQTVLLLTYLHILPEFVEKQMKGAKKTKTLWVPTTLLAALPSDNDIEIVSGKHDISWDAMTVAEKDAARDMLSHMSDVKFKYIRYNGISSAQLAQLGPDFFNDSFIVVDEVHNFISRVVNGGNTSTSKAIYDKIMNSSGSKMVFLSGSPVINHPFELSLLLNLARGPMYVEHIEIKPKNKSVDLSSVNNAYIHELLESHNIYKYVDQWTYIPNEKLLNISFLPYGYINSVNNDGTTVVILDKKQKHTESNKKHVLDKITHQLDKLGFTTKIGTLETYALPSKKSDFNKLFIDESDRENPRIINMDLFARRAIGLVSYYRTAGEEYFPTVHNQPIQKTELCNTQFNTYLNARAKERKMESRSGGGGAFGSQAKVYRAFSRMACNFVFPKEIPRVFPNDLRRALKREIESVDEDDEAADMNTYVVPVKKPSAAKEVVAQMNKEAIAKYEKSIETAMKEIDTQADTYLTLDNLRNNYSSKFAKVYEHLHASPGKVLIYSQFREIEGLGILRLILKHQGYAEIKIIQHDKGGWSIADAETVFAPEYNNKRFIIFDGNREKTQIMLQIYNGLFNFLPETIQTQLTDAKMDTSNLRGELIKIIMITQSGAEGISLKNVRRVLIVEPFWNKVRMDQVIGRAVRTNSHIELPKEEQHVDVFVYTSTFTPKQLEDNFTLRRKDNSVTSDTHIMNVALKKDELIQVFLNQLKSVSIDCRNNAEFNRMPQQGLSCYAFPIPVNSDDYGFTPFLDYDQKMQTEQNKLVRGRNIRGHVISLTNEMGIKTKYVRVDDYPNKVYDYNAYKNAGVLVEVRAF